LLYQFFQYSSGIIDLTKSTELLALPAIFPEGFRLVGFFSKSKTMSSILLFLGKLDGC